ncbi:unnamed protein product [Prorocentrum cordatum]|uniref:Uncharacterized protein n=1 Tax=Prorocentrum cordatum TaxID=2364126 RepID=A0ABN9XS74_9DINO|nr:unnamed protein product [Polarella glacialis]
MQDTGRCTQRKLLDDSRMAVQSQLDDMRRTFQDLFDEHSRATVRLMEEQGRATEQRAHGVLQACQQLEGRMEQRIVEERAAVQGALESVAQAFQHERAQRWAELEHALSSFQGGLSGDEPPSSRARDGERLDGRLDADPHSSQAGETFEARLDVDPVQWSSALEARVAQLEHLMRAAERPVELEQHFQATANRPTADKADGEPSVASIAESHDKFGLMVTEGAEVGAGSVAVPAAEGEVALGESMWDAAALIGCSEAGVCASLFTVVALSINVAVQVLFILIVNDSLTPAHFSEETVQEYESWRTMIAHNVKFVDDLTYTSLARKVCEFRDAPMSSGPIEGFASISEYLGVRAQEKGKRDAPPLGEWLPAFGIHQVGPPMCCMALMVWFCTVWKEICSIADLAQAFSRLPSGKTTISGSSSGLALTAVSSSRRGMFYSVLFVRSLVCLALATCGALYLAATISLGDLLLNAVALERIVISLDELAFEVFAPSSMRALISLIAPLPRPPSPALRGLDARPVVSLFAIGAGVAGVWWSVLLPQVEILETARSALCDGDLDFIVTCDKTGVVVAYSPTALDEGGEPVDAGSMYNYRAIRNIIKNGTDGTNSLSYGDMFDSAVGFTGGRFTVQGRANYDTERATHMLNAYCADMDWNGSLSWPVLADILESAGVFSGVGDIGPFTSCADVAPFCYSEDAVSTRVRQYCPVTCGCDDPSGELILVGTEQGCPLTCVNTPMYAQALSDMDCADWTMESPSTLYGVDLMEAYVMGLYKMGWPEWVVDGMIAMMNVSMSASGCPGLAAFMQSVSTGWSFGNLCDWNNPFGLKPITVFCPVSCGCRQSNDILCPTTC